MFVFYDFETTGTSTSFDQPIQFAAILTDYDFNQVERVDIRCRLSPHILPAPWAMAVTGVTPEQLIDLNLPSWFDFSHQIRGLIKRWAPATWAGYNSIAFDEEFLRQSFYQNLCLTSAPMGQICGFEYGRISGSSYRLGDRDDKETPDVERRRREGGQKYPA